MSKIHLWYCLRTADNNHINGHPQIIMEALGIVYEHSTPQSIGDGWQFWGCSCLPDPLPPFLEVKDWNPVEWVGRGLSADIAQKLSE